MRPVATDPRLHEVDTLCERIAGFGQLTPRCADAIVPSTDTIREARKIVRELPRGVDLPQVNPSPDGEIGFIWFNGLRQLNAVIDPDLHLVWVTGFNGQFGNGVDIDLQARSPQPLIEAVATFYR
jgi:hypothetical protein